jgi:DNA modification methylase
MDTITDIDIRLGSFAEVLTDVRANLIFTSPPYNIGSKAERADGVRSIGESDPKSYGSITDYSDNLPEWQYQMEQAQFMIWAADHLACGGVLAYNHKIRRRDGAAIHPAEWFLRPEVRERLTLMEEVVWDRGSTHNHSNRMMWPRTERIWVFRRAQDDDLELYPLTNDSSTALPQQHDSWHISVNSHATTKTGHNAPFHIDVANAVLAAWSEPGDLVCDPYTGSGSTAIAAVNLGRRFVGSEFLPNYHTIATERVADHVRSIA